MKATIIAVIFGAAIAVFLMAVTGSGTRDKDVAERFEPSKEDKRNSFSSDIMDAYKDAYGKYPQTEVLVHYRDAAMDGGLSLEEIRARIRSDGGTPPGIKMPDSAAEAIIKAAGADQSAASTASAASAASAPRVGDVPYVPSVPNPAIVPPQPGANVTALPSKLMAMAVQLSSLAEEIKAGEARGPRGIETFAAYRHPAF